MAENEDEVLDNGQEEVDEIDVKIEPMEEAEEEQEFDPVDGKEEE
jgi:hypothetical protein